MMRRAFSLAKAALAGVMVGFMFMVFASMMAASCRSPNFVLPDGEGGMGGETQLPAHCENERQDSDETDEDCGGRDCEPCKVGKSCEEDTDCDNESCISAICQSPSCRDRARNNGESDTDCGGDNCGPTCGTGATCVVDDDCRSFHCDGGVCLAPSCDDRILNGEETGTDCGGSCKGCPIGQRCVVADDCEAPEQGDAAVVECKDGVCELNCPDNTGDCNERADDGCEVDLLTSTNHCGGCDLDCKPDHATGDCVGGECLINTDEPNQGCDTNYANCNSMPEDGCEVNLLTDPDHCGACEDSACSSVGGVASCSGGECSIECTEGYGNCDENARDNGCETNTNKNAQHCGGCDAACEVSDPDYTAYCAEGACGETLCEEDKGDCDGDGICSDSLVTVANCGGCGQACTVAHGSPACEVTMAGAQCVIDVCDVARDAAWADCDGSYVTGCEVNTQSNRLRCGGCLPEEGGSGEDCSLKEGSQHVTATACGAGTCQIVGCSGGWGDCDGVFSNGCEANLNTNEAYCGSCNIDCTDKIGDDDVGAVSCQAGACRVDACSGDHLDCDGSFGNGCEVDPNTNKTHCGGCNDESGTNCNAKIDDDNVTGVECDAGVCAVMACEAAHADCDASFGNGCEVNTNTSETHCGGCAGQGGDTCEARAHAVGTCQNGGCNYECDAEWDDSNDDRNAASGSDGCESRKLTVLNYGTWSSSDTGGSGPPVTFSHTLEGASGTQRLILVGVVCRGNSAGDCTMTTATYGSAQLTLLGSVFLVDSSAQIFYALDNALPAPGSYTVTLDRNDEWGSVAADVIEFSGAEQQTFYADHAGDTSSANCDDGTDTAVSLGNLPAGSVIYAVGGGNAPSGSAKAGAPLSLASSHFADYIVLGSGYSGALSGSATPAFDFAGCYQSVMYAVGVRPERDY